jgi:hypothetical protein
LLPQQPHQASEGKLTCQRGSWEVAATAVCDPGAEVHSRRGTTARALAAAGTKLSVRNRTRFMARIVQVRLSWLVRRCRASGPSDPSVRNTPIANRPENGATRDQDRTQRAGLVGPLQAGARGPAKRRCHMRKKCH